MIKRILDTHGLMIFLEKEPGCDKIIELFTNAAEKENNLLMTSVNYGEFYYLTLRKEGARKLAEAERAVSLLPIDIVDVDVEIAKEAARFKARGGLSYADCFTAGLAKLNKGEIVTGDREFKLVESEVKVFWI